MKKQVDYKQEMSNNIFLKQQMKNNPSLAHNSNIFYGEQGTAADQKNQYQNNYANFFRGSTPTGSERGPANEDKRFQNIGTFGDAKKTDQIMHKKKPINTYNILSNQPVHFCDIEENRVKKLNHYDNYANNRDFKKYQRAFYGVDEPTCHPNDNFYKKRMPEGFMTTAMYYGDSHRMEL